MYDPHPYLRMAPRLGLINVRFVVPPQILYVVFISKFDPDPGLFRGSEYTVESTRNCYKEHLDD